MQERTDQEYKDIPKKVNDCIAFVKQMVPTVKLFDEFWHEGEVAVMYGPDRIGKSVLAVQIAEALAGGRKIDGFLMQAGVMKVLYVDLRLTDRQFSDRYQLERGQNEAQRTFEFAENFYRAAPSDLTKIADWIRLNVEKRGFRAVIVDDLQALRSRPYGIKEAKQLVDEMRTLSRETGVSVLLLARSQPTRHGTPPDEGDLEYLRAVCGRVDSTFAIAKNCERGEDRYLVQTRSPRRLFWTSSRAPICKMWSSSDVPLGFVFDERFRSDMEGERRTLIIAIKQARDHGESFDSIASCHEISKTKAFRLFREWRPSMEYTTSQIAMAIAEEEAEEREALELARKAGLEEQQARAEFQENSARMNEQLAGVFEPDSKPVATEDAAETEAEPFVDTDPLAALTPMKDHTGNEVFVERYDDRGRPEVWYRHDSKGRLNYVQRDGNGTTATKVDGPVCWLQWTGSDEKYYRAQMEPRDQPRGSPVVNRAVSILA